VLQSGRLSIPGLPGLPGAYPRVEHLKSASSGRLHPYSQTSV